MSMSSQQFLIIFDMIRNDLSSKPSILFSQNRHSFQASIITGNLYKNWRHYGKGFEIREGTYDKPNKTLISGMVFKQVSSKRIIQ